MTSILNILEVYMKNSRSVFIRYDTITKVEKKALSRFLIIIK